MGIITREDKCLTLSWSHGWFKVRFNPIVTVLSVVIIWGFVIWCMTSPENALTTMKGWKDWVNITWTWLYIGTQDVWALFIAVIFFSKYSKMKLGAEHEEPEFGDVTYFTMLFAAGIGIGLFFFGVAEPIGHYAKYRNRYWGRHSDNLLAQDAINLVFYHWGIHGWVVYVLVGLLLGFIAYRQNLPMTMRTCFYPLIGDRVFGFLGDLIDTLSVVCTMFGVCTSLGIGTIQFNKGLSRVNSDIEQSKRNQIIIIWGITAIATVSVVTGMKVGIRRLSEICFAIGCIILCVVFFYDDTWYLLNVFTQSVGYYLQWIIQIGFHADAFAQTNNTKDALETPQWIYGWTIFYWGWWISWSPFVGMFIAKISKGRTIREFIFYTLTVPAGYVFFWFSVFGGVAIKMERKAFHLNISCDSAQGGTNAVESFKGVWRLSCRDDYDMWFDVIQSYEGLRIFLSILSLIAILLYFVTSSDSGSLIIDCLSANGDPEPPVPQRVFWAVTEGATATALLYSGGRQALDALQTVSICAGLFYTMILNFMCVALWRSMKIASGEIARDAADFAHDIITPFYRIPSGKDIVRYLLAIVAPWWSLSRVASHTYKNPRWIYCLVLGIPFIAWVLLLAFTPLNKGLQYVGWALYLGFVAYAAGLRANMRIQDEIYGNLAEDFFAFLLAYPLATIQLADHVDSDIKEDRKLSEHPNVQIEGKKTNKVGDIDHGNGVGFQAPDASPNSRHIHTPTNRAENGPNSVYTFDSHRLPALGNTARVGYDSPRHLDGAKYPGRNQLAPIGPHDQQGMYRRSTATPGGRDNFAMNPDEGIRRRSVDDPNTTTIEMK